MNCADPKEITEIRSHLKQLQQASRLNSDSEKLSKAGTSGKDTNQIMSEDTIYEEILNDTPPKSHSSPNSMSSEIKQVLDSSENDHKILDDLISDLHGVQSKRRGSTRKSPKRSEFVLCLNAVPQVVSNSFELKDGSTNDTPDMKKSTFQKLNDEFISLSYSEQKNCRSSLSPHINHIRERGFTQRQSPLKKHNTKTFKVYFFQTPFFLEIPVDITRTVDNVIQQIIRFCSKEPNLVANKISYPEHPEAYFLYMLEDENDYVPDFSIPPLEGKRVFSTLGIEKGVSYHQAFIENSKYQPTVQELVRLKKPRQVNNKVMVRVHGSDETMNTTLLLSLDERVKDVFQLLAIKVKGVNPKMYDLRLYDRSLEEVIKEKSVLDQDMQLKDVINNKTTKVIEVELSRKQATMEVEETKSSDIPRSSSIGGYDEFTLTKITKHGKVNKIIGMDQNKIYELNKSKLYEKTSIIESFLSRFLSKNRERLIKDMLTFELVGETLLKLEFHRANKKKGPKIVKYESKDPNLLKLVMLKLQYLKNQPGNV